VQFFLNGVQLDNSLFTATASSMFSASFPVSNIMDNNQSSYYMSGQNDHAPSITISSTVPYDEIRVINRVDAFQSRINTATVTLYADGFIFWNSNFGSNPRKIYSFKGMFGFMPFALQFSQSAIWQSVDSQPIINLADILIGTSLDNGVTYTLIDPSHVIISASSAQVNHPISNLRDLNGSTYYESAPGDHFPTLTISTDQPFNFIYIRNRQDCCQLRFNTPNVTVSYYGVIEYLGSFYPSKNDYLLTTSLLDSFTIKISQSNAYGNDPIPIMDLAEIQLFHGGAQVNGSLIKFTSTELAASNSTDNLFDNDLTTYVETASSLYDAFIFREDPAILVQTYHKFDSIKIFNRPGSRRMINATLTVFVGGTIVYQSSFGPLVQSVYTFSGSILPPPTVAPSMPTVSPTVAPSKPTYSPTTATPSYSPTLSPTISMTPTAGPTFNITDFSTPLLLYEFTFPSTKHSSERVIYEAGGSAAITLVGEDIYIDKGNVVFDNNNASAPLSYLQLPFISLQNAKIATIEMWITFDEKNPSGSTLFSFGGTDSDNTVYLRCSSELAGNKFYVVAVYNSEMAYAKVYLNGSLSAYVNVTQGPLIGAHALSEAANYIGSNANHSGPGLIATLHSVKVWSGELLAAEVRVNSLIGDNPSTLIIGNSLTTSDVNVTFLTPSTQNVLINAYGGSSVKAQMFDNRMVFAVTATLPTCAYKKMVPLDSSTSSASIVVPAMNLTVTLDSSSLAVPAPRLFFNISLYHFKAAL